MVDLHAVSSLIHDLNRYGLMLNSPLSINITKNDGQLHCWTDSDFRDTEVEKSGIMNSCVMGSYSPQSLSLY
jgi:hypothetical protein